MSLSLNQQVFIFLIMALYGACASMLFDFFKSVYKIFKLPAFAVGICDIIFWVIVSISAFFTLFTVNDGQIRVFEFLAMVLGSVIYFLTLSPPVVFVFSVFLKMFKKIFSFFLKFFLTIALFLYKMILRLLLCISIPFKWVYGIVLNLCKKTAFKFRRSTGAVIKNSRQRRKIKKYNADAEKKRALDNKKTSAKRHIKKRRALCGRKKEK